MKIFGVCLMRRILSTLVLVFGCYKVAPVEEPVEMVPREETSMMQLLRLARPYMEKSVLGLEYNRKGSCFGFGNYDCEGTEISLSLEGVGVQFDYVNYDLEYYLGPCVETFWDRNSNGKLDPFIDYIGFDNNFDSESCEMIYGDLARKVIGQSHLSGFTPFTAVDALSERELEQRNLRFQELIEQEIDFLERTKHLNRE